MPAFPSFPLAAPDADLHARMYGWARDLFPICRSLSEDLRRAPAEGDDDAAKAEITFDTGFVANFVLWRETGYFDTQAQFKELLHLWSLAVEEHYYLTYPLLFSWMIWSRSRARLSRSMR